MPAVEIRELEKTYSTGTRALKGVSFDIEQGSMMALLGANGAGKTTLIGILTGLVKKTAGKVRVFGVDMDADPEAARAMIGVVPQEFNFSIWEKVEDIVIDQGGYYGVPYAEAKARAEVLLKKLGLWDKRRAAARTLSGGMKRRLMIARALVHKPKLLLLDEPSAGVDVELRRGMWDFVREMHEQGTTIVLTTHYLEEAEQLCEHVVIVREGLIVREGSVSELLAGAERQGFVVSVDKMPSAGGEFEIALGEELTIEATVSKGKTVTDLVNALESAGVHVKDIRPKANRLEELFLALHSGV